VGKFYEEKTEWVIKGTFGVRRIWKDDEGHHYYLLNNIAIRHVPGVDSEYEVYKASTVESKGLRTLKE